MSNKLIGSLPPRERGRLQALIQPVSLARNDVLAEAGQPIDTIVFPETCVVSLIQTFGDGRAVEVATIGCEGVLCVASTMAGFQHAQLRHVVQIGGGAWRLPVDAYMRCMEELPAFRGQVLRFVAGLLGTAYLSIACNRIHTVDRRLARWLLIIRDRTTSDRMPLTHGILAEILGVTRPTVTLAAQSLEQAGLITYRRGIVTILDRDGLTRAACECYPIGTRWLAAGC